MLQGITEQLEEILANARRSATVLRVQKCSGHGLDLGVQGFKAQGAQYSLIEECTFNHIKGPSVL